MKKILRTLLAIFLNIVVISILYQMAVNKQRGESTNIPKAAGQTARSILQDFSSGWQEAGKDTIR